MKNIKTNQNISFPRIITDHECEIRTGLKRKQRWRMQAAGEFPRRIPLADRLTGYLEAEIDAWVMQRVEQREEAIAQRRSPNPLARENRKALGKRGGA